jgi:hypothetical protein
MSLDAKLRARLERALRAANDRNLPGRRLWGDSTRLLKRLTRFGELGLFPPEADVDAMELACYAIQLPQKSDALTRPSRTSLRDRCEQAAELLVTTLGSEVEEALLDRTTRILHDMPNRSPSAAEARILADVINLDDFGMIGVLVQTIQQALQGEGVLDVATGLEKREEYGYWSARLKDGFHHEPVRQIARRRLDNARQAAKLLNRELTEDGAKE